MTTNASVRRGTVGRRAQIADPVDLLYQLTDVIDVYREADVETMALGG